MSDTEKDIKKRGPRTTKKQIELMVDFIYENKIILKAKLDPKEICIVKEKWEELTNLLNRCGQGPVKTTVQWKRAFQELKTNTRKRAREVINSKMKTGGGPANVKDLTDVELKILELISKVSIEGATEVIEAGLTDDKMATEQNHLDLHLNIDITEIPVIRLESLEDLYMTNVNEPLETPKETPSVSKSVSTVTSQTPKRPCKPQRYRAKPTNLELAVEKQSQSTNDLSKSLDSLSKSIITLAVSIEKLASAIGKAD